MNGWRPTFEGVRQAQPDLLNRCVCFRILPALYSKYKAGKLFFRPHDRDLHSLTSLSTPRPPGRGFLVAFAIAVCYNRLADNAEPSPSQGRCNDWTRSIPPG